MAQRTPATTKFVSLSQSCIPLKPLRHTHAWLLADDVSRFDCQSVYQVWPHAQPLVEGGGAVVPRDAASKAANWFVLSRRVAELCVNAGFAMLEIFARVRSPEEYYYLTTARMLIAGEDDAAKGIAARGADHAPTWADWLNEYASPKTHTSAHSQRYNGRIYPLHCCCEYP